jgi:UDP-N-acetylmuramoyl-tripeptide--D-alanyl-D-alanine ligase/cyanophycin synthetase/poly-gamma-glutamate synthesis protein (capsule biosynthesis protein)
MLYKLFLVIIIFSSGKVYPDTLNIFFLGDTYFGVSYQKFNDGIFVGDEYGYDYFFENVKDLLSRSDYTIINFEAPLCPDNNSKSPKPYLHWCNVSNTLAYLTKYGVDAVSLGNNHAMDMGEDGLMQTMFNLNASGIKFFGAGLNKSQALEPLYRKFSSNGKDFEIAVISGFEFRRSYDTLYNFYADENKTGVNKLEIQGIAEKIREIKTSNPGIFVVFFPHWGKNYKQAMEYQTDMAHSIIDAGADLIIGQGSHTVQKIEKYKDRLIIYNIGNFICNAPGRYRTTGAKPYSLMAELVILEGGRKFIRLHPVYVNNLETDYRVRFLDDEEFDECYKIINQGKQLISKKVSEYYELGLY